MDKSCEDIQNGINDGGNGSRLRGCGHVHRRDRDCVGTAWSYQAGGLEEDLRLAMWTELDRTGSELV